MLRTSFCVLAAAAVVPVAPTFASVQPAGARGRPLAPVRLHPRRASAVAAGVGELRAGTGTSLRRTDDSIPRAMKWQIVMTHEQIRSGATRSAGISQRRVGRRVLKVVPLDPSLPCALRKAN
jgi:hypothetical protein